MASFQTTLRKRFPDLAADLDAVDRLLRRELGAGGRFLQEEALRLLSAGGKRLRPVLVLGSARLGDFDQGAARALAAAVEALHMATLVHDDIIDSADKRRGQDTSVHLHGVNLAVYTGDWLLVKSLQLLSGAGSATEIRSAVLHRLAEALEEVFTGEVDQYQGRGAIPTLDAYMDRIRGKTAALFAGACAAGAKSAGLEDGRVETAGRFGEAFGMAFQIRDDLMDLLESGDAIGKPASHDLEKGNVTLPILMAAEADEGFRTDLSDYLDRWHGASGQAGGAGHLLARARSLGVGERTRTLSERFRQDALQCLEALPEGEGRAILAATLSSLDEMK